MNEAKHVKVWQTGEIIHEGFIVQILPTQNGTCVIVQGENGWLRQWPIGAVQVV